MEELFFTDLLESYCFWWSMTIPRLFTDSGPLQVKIKEQRIKFFIHYLFIYVFPLFPPKYLGVLPNIICLWMFHLDFSVLLVFFLGCLYSIGPSFCCQLSFSALHLAHVTWRLFSPAVYSSHLWGVLLICSALYVSAGSCSTGLCPSGDLWAVPGALYLWMIPIFLEHCDYQTTCAYSLLPWVCLLDWLCVKREYNGEGMNQLHVRI